jgi:hypothetical protein
MSALVWAVMLPAMALGQSTIFQNGFETGDTCSWSFSVPACSARIDVYPNQIDEVLVNPGMGFANFHFGWWCNLPPITFTPEECVPRVTSHWPTNYPGSAVAYFRWHWQDLEPVRGEIAFDLIDTTIQSANLLGETLGIRIMTILEGGVGIPQWLREPPYNVPGQWWSGTFWPDYRNATFQAEHERFVNALGQRYNDHPAMDHIDIGSVGCWGEWNTACLDGAGGIFEIYNPQSEADYQQILAAYEQLIGDYTAAFPDTPVVMLGLWSGADPDWELETMLYAIEQGAGWRVDCWGDWGFWGGWNHMEHLYPPMIADATTTYPPFADTWQHAPIQLEICGTIPQWLGFGWSADPPDGKVYLTFQWALAQHASVLNGKFTDIPAEYVAAIDDLLKENGYRFVIDRFNHAATLSPAQATTFDSYWSNLGVAPSYLRRTLAYRLRSSGYEVVLDSAQDIRTWLPGSWRVTETLMIPADLPAGTYALEVAILDRAGSNPATIPLPPLFLGIERRGTDGWYLVSTVNVD